MATEENWLKPWLDLKASIQEKLKNHKIESDKNRKK